MCPALLAPATGNRGAELLCARVLYGPLCVLHTKAAPLKLFLLSLQSECCLQGECVESERDSAAAQAWVVRAPMCFDHQCGFASERGLQLALTRFVPR